MSLFTHRERLALLRSQLSEPQTLEQREEILKLLAEEEAKDGIIGVFVDVDRTGGFERDVFQFVLGHFDVGVPAESQGRGLNAPTMARRARWQLKEAAN